MPSHAEVWQDNLTKKVEAVNASLLQYLTTKDDNIFKNIFNQIAGLRMMFASDRVPRTITFVENALNGFHANSGSTRAFTQLLEAYREFPSVAAFVDDEVVLPSFDEIFASYKEDGELQALVDEFIKTLERIIAEGDDELTAHIARELGIILAQLKKQKKNSLYELQNWVDLGMRALIMYGETRTGTHGFNLVYEALKVGWRIKGRLVEKYGEAQQRLMEQHKLTYVQKAVERFPQVPPQEQLRKLLGPGSSDAPAD